MRSLFICSSDSDPALYDVRAVFWFYFDLISFSPRLMMIMMMTTMMMMLKLMVMMMFTVMMS